MKKFDAKTRIAALIGSPISHSLSPIIHNSVFESLGLNWLYVPFLVQGSSLDKVFELMGRLGISGLSVTTPHKAEVARVVAKIGTLEPSVRASGSANTVRMNLDGSLTAADTDGAGCCNAIEGRCSLKDAAVVIIGAGSTAASIAYAVRGRGAREILVLNRNSQRADELVKRIGNTARLVVEEDFNLAVSSADVVINTTPVSAKGMINYSVFGPRNVVLDVVYRPLETELIAGAKQCGAITIDGLEMLVHQAALQQMEWLQVRGDTKLMREKAMEHLGQSGQM